MMFNGPPGPPARLWGQAEHSAIGDNAAAVAGMAGVNTGWSQKSLAHAALASPSTTDDTALARGS